MDDERTELEEFEDLEPLEGDLILPAEQPGWAKLLAWTTIVLGGIYLINPTAGIIELIPDMLPIVGNLDEATILFLMFGAMRYLGMHFPDFIERWAQPLPGLPAPDKDQEL